ncbi:MAG TPA: GNAT family N-acetyltransferase [Solirubrobacterales bacterium]|jgi:ribosomal protein S18 acetylase RimI-like enzyme|nr:GNAT family N-acetyltransferase [Solirubrobacterales bacterium]
MTAAEIQVRRAGVEDAGAIARLLHDFNREFEEATLDIPAQTEIVRRLLEAQEMIGLLAGAGPDGFAVLRLRPSLYAEGAEAYLQELYVVPPLRGRGIGRALLGATIAAAREAGATSLDLNTGETDTAARGLYESSGFSNREGGPEGPSMLYYEREL